jgi:glyoxylase-like metal-dependent hydrolase (beta-lactamase superfamily II)
MVAAARGTRALAMALATTLAMALASGAPAVAQRAFEAVADGTLTDGTHPKRPDDVSTVRVRLRVAFDEDVGEATLVWSEPDEPGEPPTAYHWRLGRLFQATESGEERPAASYRDLAPPAIAMLHPALLAGLRRERPENVLAVPTQPGDEPAVRHFVVAGQDVLWRGSGGAGDGDAITALRRPLHHDVTGDTTEAITFADRTVTVRHGGRVVAELAFGAPVPVERVRTPTGEPDRDAAMVLPPEAFVFRDLGGGLFACDLARANARVFVVEFRDRLFVFEGVFTSRNAETLLAAAQARFGKPVRHFAFSHLHPQYVGGVRANAAAGAAILVPPTTVPLVEQVLAAPFGLRPDAWSRVDRAASPPRIEPVADRWRHEDDAAAVEVIVNRRSEHTDEYLMVHLPRTGTLLTGDLLFLRPNQPLAGRSLTLARHVEELGLRVDRCLTTWPLRWPGKNDVTGDELRAAARAAAPPAADGSGR